MEQESRAIAGRTARCRCKFWYVSNFTVCGQKTTGHKTTGQKTTKMPTPGKTPPRQKATWTKGHHRWNFVILASAQTDMFAAEYRSDNSSGFHCTVN